MTVEMFDYLECELNLFLAGKTGDWDLGVRPGLFTSAGRSAGATGQTLAAATLLLLPHALRPAPPP